MELISCEPTFVTCIFDCSLTVHIFVGCAPDVNPKVGLWNWPNWEMTSKFEFRQKLSRRFCNNKSRWPCWQHNGYQRDRQVQQTAWWQVSAQNDDWWRKYYNKAALHEQILRAMTWRWKYHHNEMQIKRVQLKPMLPCCSRGNTGPTTPNYSVWPCGTWPHAKLPKQQLLLQH